MSIRYSYHIGFVALLLLLAACTKDELADDARLPEGQYPLQIAAVTLSVEGGEAQPWGAPQTRVSEKEDGNSSKFDADDKFAVQIDDKGEVGTYTVRDNNTVEAEVPLYWSDTDEHTVNAWYPDTEGLLNLSDQSQSLAYLLSGTGTGDYESPVELTFTHALAKVRITPTDDALGEVTSLQLYTYTQCTYEKGKVVQGTDEGWIKMKKCEYTENGATITCWEANVVPGYEIKKLRANGTEERNLSAAFTPEAGKFYNITLNYDKGYNLSADGRTYEVYNADGLLAWNKAVQGNLSLNCTLTDDINLTGKEWTPIGDYENRYTGTFDGGNHTITGLTVTTSDQYAGLFGCIGSGGTVKDVTLEGVQITTTRNVGDVGGVAGYSYGNIENCSVSGSVSGSGMNGFAGGVVGYQSGGFLTGCSSSATVNAGNIAGGVAGLADGGATLTACYATGNVTIESINSGGNFAGGVVGDNTNRSTVIACYAWGSVTGSGSGTIYVGGVTGTNDLGTLTACYHATGDVTGASRSTGGVVGRNYKDNYGSSIVTACYWNGTVTGDNGIGNDMVGNGKATKVEGTTTWETAMSAMNSALESNGSEWRYELTGVLPTLKKQ